LYRAHSDPVGRATPPHARRPAAVSRALLQTGSCRMGVADMPCLAPARPTPCITPGQPWKSLSGRCRLIDHAPERCFNPRQTAGLEACPDGQTRARCGSRRSLGGGSRPGCRIERRGSSRGGRAQAHRRLRPGSSRSIAWPPFAASPSWAVAMKLSRSMPERIYPSASWGWSTTSAS